MKPKPKSKPKVVTKPKKKEARKMTDDNKHKTPEPPHKTQEPAHGKAPAKDLFATEQEKDPKGGVGPADKAQPSPGPAKTIEEEGIGPRTPYPSKEGA